MYQSTGGDSRLAAWCKSHTLTRDTPRLAVSGALLPLMSIQPSPEVVSVLAAFDARSDIFAVHTVATAIRRAVGDRASVPHEYERGVWAEWAAFMLKPREAPSGGTWGTHFQPWTSGTKDDGSPFYVPDLREADAESVAYWAERAKAAKHPVLVARYADLVWDTTTLVTKAKRGRDCINFARLAIDNYIAASGLDKGSAWLDTNANLGRALDLAISVRDADRTSAAVAANIEYYDRTSDDDKIGADCYLFDRLLPARGGPKLTEKQERQLVERFEAKIAVMVAPGSKWHAEPRVPQFAGRLLAAYYQRKGKAEDRARILRGIAEMYERLAKNGDALMGVVFLDKARQTYQEAGHREEAERVQREAQALGPKAETCMTLITVRSEIKMEDLEKYLAWMMEGGFDAAMERFASQFVPRQRDVLKWLEHKDSRFIAHKILPTTKMAHGHIVAHVDDDTADPDGTMVHETAKYMQLPYAVRLIEWSLARMIREGFTTTHAMDFIRKTPIIEEDRLGLVERGIEAHLRGDYVQAIHTLLPQIEHAIRTLVYRLGKPSNKAHRTGRGVMQFKNLNDLLARDEWLVLGEDGEDLRMYFLATLAHPKGANIRNEVAHGLWPERAFHKVVSERVLHVLFAVAGIRLEREPKTDDAGNPESPDTFEL